MNNEAEKFITIIKLKNGQYQIMSADNSKDDLDGYVSALKVYKNQLSEVKDEIS